MDGQEQDVRVPYRGELSEPFGKHPLLTGGELVDCRWCGSDGGSEQLSLTPFIEQPAGGVNH